MRFSLRLEPEVEVGRVDADEDRGAFGNEARAKRAADAEQFRQVRDDLGEAAHREAFHRVPGFAALGLHLRPGDARETHPRIARPHGTDQRRRERVPGSLARHDADERRAAGHLSAGHRTDQRTTPRPGTARNSTSGRNAGSTAAAASIFARASSSGSPSR